YQTRSLLGERWPVASLPPPWFGASHAEVRYGPDQHWLRGLISPQPEPPLRIQIERSPGRESVAVLGELDIYTAPSLERAVLELEHARPLLLVIDLTGLSFIDSTGLSVLLSAAERARKQSRRLIVVRPPLPALRVFTLTRVDAGMECIDDPLDVTAQRDDREPPHVTVLKLRPRLDEPKSAQRS